MRVLITGGVGFIGVNASAWLLDRGHSVFVVDNFSRTGSRENLQWLLHRYAGLGSNRLGYATADVRKGTSVEAAVKYQKPDVILHLAAQTAVTTSVTDPRTDFEVNAAGTLNVLEAVRQWAPSAVVLFTSTNKVYGEIDSGGYYDSGRWYLLDPAGVGENQPLDFHSPYGNSKGCADQYVHDYARIYGLRTVVFRCSCIYGPRQNGTEDQGWVAHFARAIARDEPVTIYGDGGQTRDLLWVDDLCRLFWAAIEQIDQATGQVFNIGGGPGAVRSVLEVVRAFEAMAGPGRTVVKLFEDWRPGDQRAYASDVRKAERVLGWRPSVGPDEGLRGLWEWMTRPEVVAVRAAAPAVGASL